jgi:hypothetical protein
MISVGLSIWRAALTVAVGGAPADPFSLDLSSDGNLMFG